ncbi:pathogenicity island protein [Staphylococcus pasteuri]|uniref:pathogenicity island protein n=1 Tax=Staphylococcus pasteuri TaxID=45972 RepID=UPI001C263B9B|nr:pathogenicity island protein [Staphylococcus pasteuri]MCO0861709.1 pathogenicity island protein [Staphylococcus pasteuri]MCO5359850.1 pathogenicity island protein [Staphylococcus pasteuri]
MNKLNKQDYRNIEGKLNYDHIVNGKKKTKKMSKLLQKRHNRNASVIKNEYPNLNDNEISKILDNYREYQNLITAIETFTDFPINYGDSNIRQFITKDDVEDLKVAIEEMTSFVEKLEEY